MALFSIAKKLAGQIINRHTLIKKAFPFFVSRKTILTSQMFASTHMPTTVTIFRSHVFISFLSHKMGPKNLQTTFWGYRE